MPANTILVPVDLKRMIRAARSKASVERRQRAPRYGRPGICWACQDPIKEHFDSAGGWLGCPADAAKEAIFVLLPLPLGENGDALALAVEQFGAPLARRKKRARVREFRTALYTLTAKGRKTDPDTLNSPRYQTVLRTAQQEKYRGKAGVLSREMMAETGIDTRSLGQAFKLLCEHGFFDAREADREPLV